MKSSPAVEREKLLLTLEAVATSYSSKLPLLFFIYIYIYIFFFVVVELPIIDSCKGNIAVVNEQVSSSIKIRNILYFIFLIFLDFSLLFILQHLDILIC